MKDSSKNLLLNEIAHDLVASTYDLSHSEIYNPTEQQRLKQTIARLLSLYPSSRQIRVLDLGAGTGNLTRHFLAQDCDVCALDVSSKSLQVLKNNLQSDRLTVQHFGGDKIPFPDSSFDLVACYSVLHHIERYTETVQEMARVVKKDGLIFIDHEHSSEYWNPSTALTHWRVLTKANPWERLVGLHKSRQLFTMSFAKTLLMKVFVNPRFEREGDIHVWHDDHIEWDQIQSALEKSNCRLLEHNEYLLFRPKGELYYEQYRELCNDMAYGIYRKL